MLSYIFRKPSFILMECDGKNYTQIAKAIDSSLSYLGHVAKRLEEEGLLIRYYERKYVIPRRTKKGDMIAERLLKIAESRYG